jgi:hypothetical protein
VGGTIPFVAALLFSQTGNTIMFSGYLLFLAICGIVCSAIRLRTDGQYDEEEPASIPDAEIDPVK